MSGSLVAERLRWAIELLDPAPSDRVLEVGCGAGVAVSLICVKLSDGTIVGARQVAADDRPSHAPEPRARRCGQGAFQARALADADLGDEAFDEVFAVNPRLFRADAAREADVLRRGLAPEGALYLVQQHPSAERTRAVTEGLTAALERNGFAVRTVATRGAGTSTMACIVAG